MKLASEADRSGPEVPPPYVPFRTFLTALEAFETGLPNQVDRSVWPSHSGATQGQLLAAFRFFGLIDGKGTPTPVLREVVEAPEKRKRSLRTLIERSYPELIALDLLRASPRQLDDAMRRYGLSGATHRKAVSFFLHASAWADLSLSRLLRQKTREAAPRHRKEAAPPHRVARPEPPGESKTIDLHSGGTLTLSFEVKLAELTKPDRDFLFGLLDQIKAYEEEEEPG